MQTKKYWGESLSQAIEKAREDWGHGVILLEKRKLEDHSSYGGLKNGFEITVGVDEQTRRMRPWRPPVLYTSEDATESLPKRSFQRVLNETQQKEQAAELESRLMQELAALREEMQRMHQRSEDLAEARDKTPVVVPELTVLREEMQRIQQQTEELLNVRESDTMAPVEAVGERVEAVMGRIVDNVSSWNTREKTILEEISQLRREMTMLSRRPEGDTAADLPLTYATVFAQLQEKGVGSALAERVVRLAALSMENRETAKRRDIESIVQAELSKLLRPFQFSETTPAGVQQTIFLLGPTGCGKSMMAMRLASQHNLTGKNNIGVISLNPYGISAELQTFARLTGIEMREARSEEGLEKARQDLADKEMLIIDAPGRSPFAPRHLQDVENYLELVKPTDVFLVLSVNSDIKDLLLSSGLYLLANPTGVIFTKFDETTQPGKVFSLLDEVNLPPVCFSDSDKAFVEAIPAQANYLFDRIFQSH